MQLETLFTGELVQLAAAGGPAYNAALARWSEDAEYARMLEMSAVVPRTVAFYEQQEKKDRERQGENVFPFAIRTLEDDKLIGECDLRVTWNHQVGRIEKIGIGEPDYRGKGYGTDAVKLLVSYGFRELGLYRVQLGLFAYNERARRSYEKAGFTLEQVERQAFYKDGKRHDGLLMGILRPEWEARQV